MLRISNRLKLRLFVGATILGLGSESQAASKLHPAARAQALGIPALGSTREQISRGEDLQAWWVTLRDGSIQTIRASVDSLEPWELNPNVLSIESPLQGSVAHEPLDVTAAASGVPAAWLLGDVPHSLTGVGQRICNIDTSLFPFHPDFFRADGGYFQWFDEDGDEQLTLGSDTVILNGQNYPLSILSVPTTEPYSDEPALSFSHQNFDPRHDWLYLDLNQNGIRDFGSAAGSTENTPAFGEPIFVVDDVNLNHQLDLNEKLIRLNRSKIAALRDASGRIYRREQDLSQFPDAPPSSAHGTHSSSVLVGGLAFRHLRTGMAPDADLLFASRGTQPLGVLLELTQWCADENANVIMNETAQIIGASMDGSGALGALTDSLSAKGIATVAPTGNHAGAGKAFLGVFAESTETTLPIALPSGDGPYSVFVTALHWPDATRTPLLAITEPDGTMTSVPIDEGENLPPTPLSTSGNSAYAAIGTSARGTRELNLTVFSDISLPTGTWSLHLIPDPMEAPTATPLFAFVLDDATAWSGGSHFLSGVSEAHLVGYPAVLDAVAGVGAYGARGYWGNPIGKLSEYSSGGLRIDGTIAVDLVAPDDPIVASTKATAPVKYAMFGGTSAAAPHVGGALALWKQHSAILGTPQSKGTEAIAALRTGARSDAWTGPLPNVQYGAGKLDLHRAITGQSDPGGHPPSVELSKPAVYAGVPVEIPLRILDAEDALDSIRIDVDRDYDGEFEETLSGSALPVSYPQTGDYVIKLRATDPGGRFRETLGTVHVTNAPIYDDGGSGGGTQTEEQAPRTPETSPNCGCHLVTHQSHRQSASGLFGFPLLLGMLRLLGRSRRHAASPKHTRCDTAVEILPTTL